MPWQRKADAPYVIVLDAGIWSGLLIRWPWLQYLAPALAGEIIDVTTFCAAGPMTPAVTMNDIVWFGFPPDDGRPHTILTVTRAIARQELFAQYCEQPGVNCQLLDRVSTWNWASPNAILRHGAMVCDITYDCFDLVNGATSVDAQVYTCSDAGGGSPIKVDEVFQFGVGQVTHYGVALFGPGQFIKVGGSVNPQGGAIAVSCNVCITGATDYIPPEPVQDPNVVLPTGTGATLDELEQKLDQIQQQLRRNLAPNFALDVSTITGVDDQAVGQLGDAIGLLVLIQSRPITRSSWSADPPRYPRLARLTLGNDDGWWTSVDLEHEESVFLPLPLGATRWAITCEPPMTASVTLYRPILGP
jgi:hypothetical protein